MLFRSALTHDRQTAPRVGGGVAGSSAFICSSDCRLISIDSFIRGGEGHALPHVRAQRSPERVALASNRGDLLVSHRSARRELLHFERERLGLRSEEHTSELQSLMRISYAVFSLKNNRHHIQPQLQQQN